MASARYIAGMTAKQFTRSLRDAVIAASVTRAEISRATGISQANLCRLVQGTRGLSMENLDAIIDYLDLELRPRTKKGK